MLSTVIGASEGRANHISGMNVSYECLGGNNYLVSIHLFRGCSEFQPLPDTLSAFVISSCLTLPWQEFPLVSLDEVSQLCAAELPNSTCNGGLQPGTQLGLYQLELELEPCIDWQIILAEQNRSGDIVNLLNPGSARIHVEAFLNNVSANCNNSPQLTVLNLPYICVGSPLFYNLGFIDVDGDSLVYSFVPALDSTDPLTTMEMGYAGSYSGAEPITGITIDPYTGQIEVTPNMIGNFNVVVRVEEYRNGIKIGEVRHDFVFLVNACPIPPPQTVLGSGTNISGGAYPVGDNLIGICAEDDFCFQIDFESTDPGVNVFLSSNIANLIPGATENQTGNNPATIEFCGTIPPGFTGGPFVITALDDACPVYGQAYYAMEFVFREPLEAFGDVLLCEGVVADVYAINDTNYTWTHPSGSMVLPGSETSCNPCQYSGIVADTTAWYTVTGEYANSSCSNVDSVFIEVPLDMNITTSDETCIGTDGVIDIEVISGSTNLDVSWSDIGPGPLTRTDLVAGDYQVLIIDDDYGCSKVLSFTVIEMTVPTANAGIDIEVCGLTTNLGAIPSSGVREWTAISDGVFDDATAQNTLVTVPAAGTYDFIWTENSGGGCIDSDTVSVTFYDMPGISITSVDSICGLETSAEVDLENGSFEWSGSSGVLFSDPLANDVEISVSNYGISELYINAVNGACTEAATKEVRFIEIPETAVPTDFSVCDDQTSIDGFESVGTGFWNLPSGLSTLDNVASEIIGLNASSYGAYELIRYSEHLGFCFDSDTLEVRFVEQPIVELTDDLVACSDEVEKIFTLPVGGLSWELPTELNPIAVVETPTMFQGNYGTHTAVLHANNGYGCIDSDTLDITLIEQPIASIVEPDTVCGLSTNLVADGTADVTYWVEPENTFVLSLLNPNTPADADIEGDYSFDWVLENGGVCRDTSHHFVTFYDQPTADAGPDQELCSLTAELEGIPTYGNVTWTSNGNVNFADATTYDTEVTADWYGTFLFEMFALNGNCESTDEVSITFLSQPEIVSEQRNCTGADSEFILSFELAYGDSAMHTVTGLSGQIENFIFTSDPILSETPIEVVFFDDGMCGGDTITDSWFCPVITKAGQMNPDTIHFCDAVLAESPESELYALDLNDTLMYALHTSVGAELGQVLDWNSVPSFDYHDEYAYETVYYISAVVGNAVTDGVEMSDPFLSVAAGTPIVFHQNPIAEMGGDLTACPIDEVSIPVNFTGVFPQTLSYVFGGVETSQTVLGPDFEIQAPDSGLYVLTNVSTSRCAGTVSGDVRVSYFEIPAASIAGPIAICEGETAEIGLFPQGNGPFDYDLALNGTVVSSFNQVFDGIFDASMSGIYQIVNLNDENCGQADTAAFYLDVRPLPIVDAGVDIYGCSGDTILIGTPAIFGNGYVWQNHEGLLGTDNAQVEFTAINNGPFGDDYELILEAERHGCYDQDTVIVNIFDAPLPQMAGGSELCRGDSLSLIGFGGDVHWSPSPFFSDTSAFQTWFSAVADTEITLSVTTEFGCTSSLTREIQVLDSPKAIFSSSELSGCAPLELNLSALFPDPTYTYDWDVDGQEAPESTSSIEIEYGASGSYDAALTVTADNGCSKAYTLENTIEVFDTYADFSFDDSELDLSHPDVFFINQSPANVSSTWTFDSLATSSLRNVFFNFPDEIGHTYFVCLEVMSPEGCIDQYCDDVEIKDDFFIYVPNSFTPDGDGLNDLFYPVLSFADVKEYHFWISDTKGQTIFESFNPDQKWTGETGDSNYYGRNTSYIWHLVVKPDFSVETQYFTGHVIMIR